MQTERIWIPKYIYEDIIVEAEEWGYLETGGIFMGYHAKNKDIVVTASIDAGENALHKKNHFSPDHKYQLSKIANIFKKSNGTITYLGDWHTHPSSSPCMSMLDKKTLTKIAKSKKSRNSKPIMAIIGISPDKWRMDVFRYISGKSLIWPFIYCDCKKLEIKIFNED